MRTFLLLLFGVVVGWAASGVDWNREAGAQLMSGPESNSPGLITAHTNNLIEDDHPRTERFQVAAYGNGGASGCFVVDSMTGRLWHATPGTGVAEIPKQK